MKVRLKRNLTVDEFPYLMNGAFLGVIAPITNLYQSNRNPYF